MKKAKCPKCGNIQEIKPLSEKAKIMGKFFNFTYESTIKCEVCDKLFIKEENEVKNET